MTTPPDLFHSCALVAFVEVARACGGWPDSKAVKARAYELYEQELARKNAVKVRGWQLAPDAPQCNTDTARRQVMTTQHETISRAHSEPPEEREVDA